MSEAFKCDICGAPATVHMTQILNGKTRKVHLCERCAAKQAGDELSVIKFAEALTKKIFGEKLGSEIIKNSLETIKKGEFGIHKKCPKCGTSDLDVAKNGRFGCPECYETFSDALAEILPKIQHATAFCGNAAETETPAECAPADAAGTTADETDEALETRLRNAVEKEDYALAAKLRDALRERRGAKSELENPPKKSGTRSRKTASAKAKKSAEKPGKSAPRSRRKGKSQ